MVSIVDLTENIVVLQMNYKHKSVHQYLIGLSILDSSYWIFIFVQMSMYKTFLELSWNAVQFCSTYKWLAMWSSAALMIMAYGVIIIS